MQMHCRIDAHCGALQLLGLAGDCLQAAATAPSSGVLAEERNWRTPGVLFAASATMPTMGMVWYVLATEAIDWVVPVICLCCVIVHVHDELFKTSAF
jgi:hypothetical protein